MCKVIIIIHIIWMRICILSTYDYIEILSYVVCKPSIHTCVSEVSYIYNILLLHNIIISLSMVLLNNRD